MAGSLRPTLNAFRSVLIRDSLSGEVDPAEYPGDVFQRVLETIRSENLSEEDRTAMAQEIADYKAYIERSHAEGHAEGMAEALCRTVTRQLTTLSGGVLADSVRARIEGAAVAQLEGWLDRVVRSATLEEVFAE